MEFRYTQNQVARGARADAETRDRLFLIKRSSQLRATYQIRLLAYVARERGKKLVIEVPKKCVIHGCLRDLIAECPRFIKIERA